MGERGGRRFDLERTPACEGFEELLPDIARLRRGGDDPSPEWAEAVRHVEGCGWCGAIVAELVRTPTEADEAAAMEGEPVVPGALFQRALVAGLADPDEVVRARAARRLGEEREVGAAGLAALAKVATEDPDRPVRAAALAALDRLDAEVSIPQRVIDAWSGSPAEAGPFVAGVLERLSRRYGITEARGEVTEEDGGLWLTLGRLPAELEGTKPVVVAPDAAQVARSEEPVAGGSVRVPLGRVGKGGLAAKERALRRLFVLDPARLRQEDTS